MILVADSGSTKCDWVIISDKQISDRVSTNGINPTFCSIEQVSDEVRRSELISYAADIREIWFYGTGCSSPERNAIVQQGLAAVFPDADIHIDHDLMGAAIATCGNSEGIACILGTGSNACCFDGRNIINIKAVFGIGYILGDEGSGAHLGKVLMKRWLYNQLPEHIANALVSEYKLDKATLFHQVYKQAGANTYLASYTAFLHKHLAEPSVKALVKDCFAEFIHTHIPQFPRYKELPINFVGSIAHHFSEILTEVLSEAGLKKGIIIKQPIENLAAFHADVL